MNRRGLAWVLAASLGSAPLLAAQVTLDLAAQYADSSSTGVWNRVTQSLHVPFAVTGLESTPYSIGNGEDGVFDNTTYANFDALSGAIAMTVTLDTSRTYNFTNFTLPAGVTLKAQGTAPLDIRVQGNAVIDGTIDLKGIAGTDAYTPALNTSNGGAAASAGGAGGSGTSSLVASGDGLTPSGTPSGLAGTLSAVGGTDAGAGGGGGNSGAGNPGAANAPASGNGGAAYGDANLVTLVGGGGGGGGAGNTVVGSAGGGGGGGGGALSIAVGGSFTCSVTCLIETTGGAGGNAAGPTKAGGGGGGAGGALRLYAGGAGVDNGSILSLGGTGGTGAVAGGDGSLGVHKFSFVAPGTFTGTGSENPNTVASTTFYSILSHQIISRPYDTQNTFPNYTEFTKTEVLNGGDSTSYEIAGSSDGFVSDNTGYFPVANIDNIDGKRYFRVRVTMQSASAATTPTVTAMAVTYAPGFAFSIAGCASVSPAAAAPLPLSALAVWVMYFMTVAVCARKWLVRRLPTR